MTLPAKIEALLFRRAEPVAVKKLAEWLEATEKEIQTAVDDLRRGLAGRGLALVETGDQVSLGTSPEISEVIGKLSKEELAGDLGRAGAETLSIVLYEGPIARSNIDYIRGVNSQFILRALLVRGLVEKSADPSDQRSYLYKPTIKLLESLGITKISELPEYQSIREKIEKFKGGTMQADG